MTSQRGGVRAGQHWRRRGPRVTGWRMVLLWARVGRACPLLLCPRRHHASRFSPRSTAGFGASCPMAVPTGDTYTSTDSVEHFLQCQKASSPRLPTTGPAILIARSRRHMKESLRPSRSTLGRTRSHVACWELQRQVPFPRILSSTTHLRAPGFSVSLPSGIVALYVFNVRAAIDECRHQLSTENLHPQTSISHDEDGHILRLQSSKISTFAFFHAN